MNDQLLCGLALASVGVAVIASGVPWLAAGLFAAAIPFVAVGILLGLGGMRARREHTADPSR
jgi:hypothetical protein